MSGGWGRCNGLGLPSKPSTRKYFPLKLTCPSAISSFKIAAVPFHFWCPDVYQGAATPVTALLSVAPKAAGFGIVVRFFFGTMAVPVTGAWDLAGIIDWQALLVVLSVATMTLGNVAALTQNNVKRLLAYSSISHAGFVLMGLVAGGELGVTASAVYLAIYAAMNLGTWTILILLRRKDIRGEEIEDFNGLFFKRPGIAVLMLVFLLSLAGIPPLGGFIAKYFVFAAVIKAAFAAAGPSGTLLIWLAVVGAGNAVVALYYYLRIVVAMFIRSDYQPARLSFSVGIVLALVITGFLTILMGVYPQPFIELARSASLPLI